MLQDAIDLQNEAVKKLIELSKSDKKEITFKAPTGSGKTYMMANFMNQVLSENDEVIFLVTCLSKGGLAKQNYDKFTEYSNDGDFTKIDPFLISSEFANEETPHIDDNHNVYILPKDLFKKKSILFRGIFEAFLSNITKDNIFGAKGKRIFLIKDECHISIKRIDNLIDKYFDRCFNFSATPKLSKRQVPDVEITNEQAEQVKLIKHVEIGDENASVDDVVNKFEEIKSQYRNLLNINPCLIIQISNKNKSDDELEEIKRVLNKSEHVDLKWMYIVEKEKECDTNDQVKFKNSKVEKWKDLAKNNSSTIDIIIFKLAISEGWDIPRACMLYQMRQSRSKQLDEQVMGRVRRNPRLKDFEDLTSEAQNLAMTSWIWGVVPESLHKSYYVELKNLDNKITNEFKVKTTRLKNLGEEENFDFVAFLKTCNQRVVNKNIFESYRKLKTSSNDVRKIFNNFVDSYDKYFEYTNNLDEISKQSKNFKCEYDKCMEIVKDNYNYDIEFSLPIESYFLDNEHYIDIEKWVWKRKDNSNKFSFDSEAEKEWAMKLLDLISDDVNNNKRIGKFVEDENKEKIYLLAKNYMPNSDIKFEYYLGGSNSNFSYPDFVMKDCYNRIHIFEVKSINFSNQLNNSIDSDLYENKVNEFKKMYKYSSFLTKQIFYLPIKKEDNWHIFKYENGIEEVINYSQFKDFVKNKNNI
ncbi:MAG: DEAD/DEAH box helicase family protein [Bacilli bacterium]|jgi:type III restriction enzyme|nr:DEAD/DEAH box helicase family protein [Bacilli bacterium]